MISRIFRSLVSVAAASALVSLIAVPRLHAQEKSSLVTNRLTQPIDANSLVTLRGTVSPLANAANDRGAAPDSMPLDHLQVVLKRSAAQESALQQLIQQQHEPGSPNYHKWLTPAQFAAQFGPSDQDVATLEAWLQSQGFNVTGIDPGKQTLNISGNVAQFRNAFHAQIHKYMVNGETHYANATSPQIPSALAPVFGGFSSLNNFRPHPYSHLLGQATYNVKTGQSTPQWTYGNNSGVSFALSPGDFAKQYDLPTNLDGTGETIAIINESNINIALVNQFRTLFGLPANPPQVILAGNDPGINGINNPDGENGAATEAYLDVEWAGAVAPKATVDLVIAADTALENGLILAAEQAVYSDLAPVMSVSFGLCEQELGSSNAFISSLWEQAAAEGITVLVSAGDSGSAGCDDDNTQQYAVLGQAVSGWASTPYNVAVGGTDFYYSDYNQGSTAIDNQLATYWNTSPSQNPSVSLLTPIPEQPWNDSQYGLNIVNYYQQSGKTTIAGGSGGASTCATGTVDSQTGEFDTCTAGYAKPAWQSGTGVPNDKVRDIPDVSLFAADGLNGSFYPICAGDGDCQPASGSNLIQISGVGGTSAAAPSFAGIMALVNEKYGPQGQADAILYPLAAQYPAAFHDVTVGTNSVPCATTTVTNSETDVTYSPLNCISVSGGLSIKDSVYGTTTEGEIGSGATADYNATSGYDLATGLGSVDANVLINDWNKVSFTSAAVTLTSPTAGATFTHGQQVAFTGTVTGSTPSGDVSIQTDSTEPGQQAQGYAALTGGAFTLNTSTLPGGTYDVWAHYGGDTHNAAAQSTPFQITVSPENSGIAFNVLTPGSNGYEVISSGTGGIPYGTQILLSGIVTPSADVAAYQKCLVGSGTCPTFTTPTGTLTFTDGSTTYSAPLDAEGEAEFNSATTYSPGAHSISASYSGDNSYNASSATALSFTVVKATPTIYVTAGYGTVSQGQPITLTVLVEGNGVGLAPSGTVSISGGPSGTPTSATLSATVDPTSGTTAGTATITIPTSASTSASLAPQDRNGIPGWLTGSGAALACVLLVGIPSRRKSWRGMMGLIVITLFTLSVSIGCGSSGGTGTGTTGGGGSGTGGTTIGNYTINVSYSGDTNYNAATGSGSFSVTAASTLMTSTTSVTSTSTSPNVTAPIGVTVTVNGVSGKAAPTGTVQLFTGVLTPNSDPTTAESGIIASGSLTAGSGSSSTLSLSFTDATLFQGANLLTVYYKGDSNYAPSSTTLNLSNPLSDFSMVPAQATTSFVVPATGTASPDTINVSSYNGLSGSVALSCTPPPGVAGLACSVSPTSVNLTGTGNTASSQLTVTTTGASAGTYEFTITGSASGPITHTIGVAVTVQ